MTAIEAILLATLIMGYFTNSNKIDKIDLQQDIKREQLERRLGDE